MEKRVLRFREGAVARGGRGAVARGGRGRRRAGRGGAVARGGRGRRRAGREGRALLEESAHLLAKPAAETGRIQIECVLVLVQLPVVPLDGCKLPKGLGPVVGRAPRLQNTPPSLHRFELREKSPADLKGEPKAGAEDDLIAGFQSRDQTPGFLSAGLPAGPGGGGGVEDGPMPD